jgi:uncharacterized protein
MKQMLFFIVVLCFFSFLEAKAGLRDDLSKQKYSFSVPVLDETECMKRVIMNGDEPEDVFKLMWEDAFNGNEKIQKKLLIIFQFPLYEKAKERVPLLQDISTYSLEKLVDIGISQKKSWAFYEKALNEEDLGKKEKLLYKAFNTLNFYEYKIEFKKYNQEIHKIKNSKTPLNLNNKKLRNEIFQNCLEDENAIDLFYFYNNNINIKNESIKSFLLKCLGKSAELGFLPAYQELLKVFSGENNNFDKKDLKGLEFYSRIALVRADPHAMANLARYLCKSNSEEEKREGAELMLKAGEIDDNPGYMMEGVQNLIGLIRNNEEKLIIRQVCEEAEKLANLKGENIPKKQLNDLLKGVFYFLGITYLPDFMPENSSLEKSALYFCKAAEMGYPESAYRYGLSLLQGFEGQEPNKEEGEKWILRSAEQGFGAAIIGLGQMCLDQAYDMEKVVCSEKLDEAYEWFKKAAETGNPVFEYNLGALLLLKKFGPNFLLSLAEKYLLDSASKNYKLSILLLSCYYHEASKICSSKNDKRQKLKKIESWIEKAYQAGCFDDFLKGEQSKDLLKLEEHCDSYLFEPMEDQQSQDLDKKVGQCFNYLYIPVFFSVGMDDRCRVKLLYNLALIRYKKHFRDSKQMKEVYNIFQVCANKGHVLSMYKLGELWQKGFCNQKSNLDKAVKWYLRAAEQNYGPAMVALANLYVSSHDVADSSQKLKDTLFWYEKAKSLGEISARDFLKISENLQEEIAASEVESEVTLVENVINQRIDESFDFEDIKIDIQSDKNHENQKVESPREEFELSVHFENENLVEEKCSNFVTDQVIDNPKYIRDQLKKMGLLKKKIETKENKQNILVLSSHNQKIVDMLKDKMIKNKNIDFTQLVNLFTDPFFEGQVTVEKSKSGCIITAKNIKTLDYAVASTHKKHNKSYDGLNPAFAKELLKILDVFGL